MPTRYLITGSAGFIGFHLCRTLLDEGHEIIGVDNFFPYYAPMLKEGRHHLLKQYPKFSEARIDLCDLPALEQCFQEHRPDSVCHLAAQAGVRYSLVNPFIYQKSNIEGFLNVLELSRKYRVAKFVYASSSSVYGNILDTPYHEGQVVDIPVSLYAATKRANELMAYTYTHLYGLPTVGLRYFTVYGPWGRPDMAMWIFADAISASRPIQVFNHGKMERDFTYIDDIIAGTKAALENSNLAPYEIINLGNNRCENIMKVVRLLEQELKIEAKIRFLPIQAGDIPKTYASIDHAIMKLGYHPTMTIETGVPKFVKWFQENADLVADVRKFGILGCGENK